MPPAEPRSSGRSRKPSKRAAAAAPVTDKPKRVSAPKAKPGRKVTAVPLAKRARHPKPTTKTAAPSLDIPSASEDDQSPAEDEDSVSAHKSNSESPSGPIDTVPAVTRSVVGISVSQANSDFDSDSDSDSDSSEDARIAATRAEEDQQRQLARDAKKAKKHTNSLPASPPLLLPASIRGKPASNISKVGAPADNALSAAKARLSNVGTKRLHTEVESSASEGEAPEPKRGAFALRVADQQIGTKSQPSKKNYVDLTKPIEIDLTHLSPVKPAVKKTLEYWQHHPDPFAKRIVLAAIPYLRLELMTKNAWPAKDVHRVWARSSLEKAVALIAPKFIILDGMVEAVCETTAAWRARFKATAWGSLGKYFGIHLPKNASSPDLDVVKKVTDALEHYNYCWREFEMKANSHIPSRKGAYEHPLISDVLATFYTVTKNSSEDLHPNTFADQLKPMPETAIAFALTAIEAALQDVKTGLIVTVAFSGATYSKLTATHQKAISDWSARHHAEWSSISANLGVTCCNEATASSEGNFEPMRIMFFDGE